MDVIENAIRHIEKCQNDDGSFTSLSSFSKTDFKNAKRYTTTFLTSNILNCLNEAAPLIRQPGTIVRLEHIRKNAKKFLIQERSTMWSWNYWHGRSEMHAKLPYPDDLDDTFLALAALYKYKESLITGNSLASIARLLTTLEVQEGGPYKTWLVGPQAPASWKDVDTVVNSNIAYFLSLLDVRLPNLENFIDHTIESSHLTSPYYPDIFPIIYFIARAYQGKHRVVLANTVIEKLQENSDAISPLGRALAITAGINLGATDRIFKKELWNLLNMIKEEGWQPYAFCIDPSREGRICYAGASALSAAFYAEAFAKSSEPLKIRKVNSREKTVAMHRANFMKRIKTMAENECIIDAGPLRAFAAEKINAIDDEKIILLAYDFREALGETGAAVFEDIIECLSMANLYGWIAYEIYDDALDGEKQPHFLSIANLFLRKLTERYFFIDQKISGSKELFHAIMNQVDNANTWEQIHCRASEAKYGRMPRCLPTFGDYENLASRSMGHALGPLVQLLCLGFTAESPEFFAVKSMFEHYLIARQLHDDAHDWSEDLAEGRLTSVVCLILEKSRNQSGVFDLLSLKNLFWTDVIEEVVEKILFHITAARQARKDARIVDRTFMEKTFLSLEHGAKLALKERDQALQFLKGYSSVNSQGT